MERKSISKFAVPTDDSDDYRQINQEGRSRKRINDLGSQRVTNFGQTSASESLMLEHKRRLQDPLRLQKENFDLWNQEDFEQTKGNILKQDFTNQESNEENLWEYANFNPGGSYECPSPQIINSWTTSKLTGTNRGLLIRSQIIKTIKTFTLRTMAVSINVKGRLYGNSMFWIFTRVRDNIETSKPICILKKMPDSQRIFCIFGQMVEKISTVSQGNTSRQLDGDSAYEDNVDDTERKRYLLKQSHVPGEMQFKFFKNQEIPEFFYNLDTDQYLKQPQQKAQQEDFVDFNMVLIDNGDDRVCLQVGLNDRKTLNLICQMYMPIFDATKILFAGSGHATYLKEVSVKQIQRQDYFKTGLKEGHFECCNTF